jgi:hypothetical protein
MKIFMGERPNDQDSLAHLDHRSNVAGLQWLASSLPARTGTGGGDAGMSRGGGQENKFETGFSFRNF